MHRSRELGKATLPRPHHRAHPTHPASGVPPCCVLFLLLRTHDRTKYSQYSLVWLRLLQNGAPSETAIRCERIPGRPQAYLMKTALSGGMPLKPNHLLPTQTPHFQGNKRSTVWLSPVSGNVIFKQRNSM